MSERPVARRRAAFFGQQVVRLMTKTCVANELGPTAFTLLAVVSATQDAAGGRPVTFYNDQLMPLVGIRKWETLDTVRKDCIAAGWLNYTQAGSGKRKPGLYEVVIPSRHAHLSDSRCDEGSPEAYPENGYGEDKAYPPNGDGHGDAPGYAPGYAHGESPSSPSTSPSKRVAAPLSPSGDGGKEDPRAEKVNPTSTRKKKPGASFDLSVIPSSLQTSEFLSVWKEWFVHRSEIGHAMTLTAARQALAKCCELGPNTAVVLLRKAMANGWRGFDFGENAAMARSRSSAGESMYQPLTAPVRTSSSGTHRGNGKAHAK